MKATRSLLVVCAIMLPMTQSWGQLAPVVPKNLRGNAVYERKGMHDANDIRTEFWNFGMVGNYPADPLNVDLTTFHSMEVPKGSGVNYSDGTTPFVLSKIQDQAGVTSYIMETGYRERQPSRSNGQMMRFEPRPGYFEADVTTNRALSPAVSNDPRTWPSTWSDRDHTWDGAWDGYFGKRPAADEESFTVMDDDYYDGWQNYFPDSRDPSRRGLGMRVEVRGFQWANVQSQDVIFWHYDITNEGTTDYPQGTQLENIIFGIYMDSGVGGEAISCDGIAESDDDNAYWDKSYAGLNLVYTWDLYGHGVGIGTTCAPTGYLGYAYLETPGKPYDGIDNDDDGITDESRSAGPGQLIVGQGAIAAYVQSHYDMTKFEAYYGKLQDRPAFIAGRWWTGDEDMDWVADRDDVGADGIPDTHDIGEGDGIPTSGEPNFDKTDPDESDQIGLTGFKMNRIAAGKGNPSTIVDNIVFYNYNGVNWPQILFDKFNSPIVSERFDNAVANNYNIAFFFASGPFTLKAGDRQRFSLALAYGSDLSELRTTVSVVQAIYNANYQFSQPPPLPTVKGEVGDGYAQVTWDDAAENGTNAIVGYNAFEGYKIYRSTDPDFLDPKVILTARGTTTIGNGKPIAQFDAADGRRGYTATTVEGIAFYLGDDTGLTHSWRDTSVTNGQQYYYAVCSYDWGPTLTKPTSKFTYYPSESAIAVTRTLRGGTILPPNVVLVRPNPRVLGFSPAAVSPTTHAAGDGYGSVGVKMVNSSLVPNNHLFEITFNNDPDSVHAQTYTLTDSTAHQVLYKTGNVFDGSVAGQIGSGVLPVVYTPTTILVDSSTGFAPGSPTNAKLSVLYNSPLSINYRRTAFPADFTIRFSDTVVDTSLNLLHYPAIPVKFTVIAHTAQGDKKLKFRFHDIDGDQTLSHNSADHEVLQILTGDRITDTLITWEVRMVNDNASTITPTAGDVFEVHLDKPFSAGDEFLFTSTGEVVSAEQAKLTSNEPYVVPNPYVGAASFESANFGVQGRGERRIEFRNIARGCTIRIYTVRGDLVRTLVHDGSTSGYVSWDLRSKDNMDVAPGLYIYHVDAGPAGTHIGKFAIIK